MAVRQLIRRSVRQAGATFFHYSGLRSAAALVRRRWAGGRRVLILGYHRVVDDLRRELQRSIPAALISTGTFRRQLEAAAAAGYEFASLDRAVDVITGQRPAKKDLIVITFDDGYRDIYLHAYPILKLMGIPAILYLPATLIGTQQRFDHDRLYQALCVARRREERIHNGLPPSAVSLLAPVLKGRKTVSQTVDDFIAQQSSELLHQVTEELCRSLGDELGNSSVGGEIMSWPEARRMSSDGFQFGAHTLRHVVLTWEGPTRIEREIVGSKELIERELGTRVEHFSYCNGWYSEQIVRCLVRHGFRSAVTTEDSLNRIGGDPFALKRKILHENFSIGPTGRYSRALTACHLDDVFGTFGIDRPVIGRRRQRISIPAAVETMRDRAEAENSHEIRGS